MLSLRLAFFLVLFAGCGSTTSGTPDTGTDVAISCPTTTPSTSGTCNLPNGSSCSYGAMTYSPNGCGGIVVTCTNGSWTSSSHTDPGPCCATNDPGVLRNNGCADAGNAPDAFDATTDMAISCPSMPRTSGPCDLPNGSQCTYGATIYSPTGCGGVVVTCTSGNWTSSSHTDPGPCCATNDPSVLRNNGCLDAGVDAGSGPDASDAAIPTD